MYVIIWSYHYSRTTARPSAPAPTASGAFVAMGTPALPPLDVEAAPADEDALPAEPEELLGSELAVAELDSDVVAETEPEPELEPDAVADCFLNSLAAKFNCTNIP